MYKIHSSCIQKDNIFIPINQSNSDYQKIIQDVAEQGIEIVEGPDIIEPDYRTLRQQKYPSLQEQQDMQYWDQINGTTVWQDTITAIKEEYPKTITGGVTIGEVPGWVQEAADNWIYNQKLNQYITALETLINFTVYNDRPEVDHEEYIKYQKSISIINEFIQEYLNS
jgi:lipoate synthase